MLLKQNSQCEVSILMLLLFFYWTTVIFEMVSGFTYSRTLCAWWEFSQHYVTLKSFSVACYVSKSALSRACWLQKIGHMPSGANFVCSAECSSMDMNAGALFSSVAFTVQEKLVQAFLMWWTWMRGHCFLLLLLLCKRSLFKPFSCDLGEDWHRSILRCSLSPFPLPTQ